MQAPQAQPRKDKALSGENMPPPIEGEDIVNIEGCHTLLEQAEVPRGDITANLKLMMGHHMFTSPDPQSHRRWIHSPLPSLKRTPHMSSFHIMIPWL